MDNFVRRWKSALNSSAFSWIFHPDMLKDLETFASSLLKDDIPEPKEIRKRIHLLLHRIQSKLILQFGSLLEVTTNHVWEVVSSMTDIPFVEFLPSVSAFKETAFHKAKQQVVDLQDKVMDGIFEVLAFHHTSSMRKIHVTAHRPRGLFLFKVGQEDRYYVRAIAKAVSEQWYGDVSRFVYISMSEYADDPLLVSSSGELLSRSSSKVEHFKNTLFEFVKKRPYSVFLLDRVDEASLCAKSLFKFLCNEDDASPSNGGGGCSVDFSKSIIFMTLSRLEVFSKDHKCLYEDDPETVEEGFKHEINCSLMSSETILSMSKELNGYELLDSLVFDRAFVIDPLSNQRKKIACRMLLRELVAEVLAGRYIVHISDAALNVLLYNSGVTSISTCVERLKQMLVSKVRPLLAGEDGGGYDDYAVVVYVDALVGMGELSVRLQVNKRSLADWYFKLENGTFGRLLANLRLKMQSAYDFFMVRDLTLRKLDKPYFKRVSNCLVRICRLLSTFTPSVDPNSAVENVVRTTGVLAFHGAEEKEKLMNEERKLSKTDTSPAKATRIIVAALVKIIDGPLGLAVDKLASSRNYLFLCLHDDAKRELIECLTDSLKSYTGDSLFTYVKLTNDCRGEEVKKLLIEKVKGGCYCVFMLDEVEHADEVLYSSLLEIFDEGTLYSGEEGFTVDFRKAIVILTSKVANERAINNLLCGQPGDSPHMSMMKQNGKRARTELLCCDKIIRGCCLGVKQFRHELLHRVDEIILLNPISPEYGEICRLSKCSVGSVTHASEAVSSLFLIKMFVDNGRCLNTAFLDQLEDIPTRFHLIREVGDTVMC
ncbi:unnamed protein product [Cuscuta europaea]|uniref:ATPase AAA-type core domain-containing protein n=1 Tax=Cuscuta europaea TaxID=41803 RepID=A0A9P1E895_CUSEU|nr:unnamed protein product [Cuscuta europaea]